MRLYTILYVFILIVAIQSHEVSHSEAFIGRFLHNALELMGNEVTEDDLGDRMHSNVKTKTEKYKSLLGDKLLFLGRLLWSFGYGANKFSPHSLCNYVWICPYVQVMITNRQTLIASQNWKRWNLYHSLPQSPLPMMRPRTIPKQWHTARARRTASTRTWRIASHSSSAGTMVCSYF